MQQVILITGTSRGIGKALAQSLRDLGHTVYGSSRKAAGEDPQLLRLDVTDPESCNRAVAEVIKREGKLDVLINNAGFHLTGASEETTLDEIRDQMDLNFYGSLYMIKAVTPQFLAQRSGKIINMSSLGGLLSLPFTSAYNASKFALEGYTEALRLELLPLRIFVSNLEPAYINTGTVDQSIGGPANPHPIFAPYRERLHQRMLEDSVKGIALDQICKVVNQIVMANKPRFRYKVGRTSRLLTWLQAWVPQGLFERMVLRSFQIPLQGWV
jgi:NAD(P)-dependent dehydrogenase (short-subunit alcohol dehydrogenase family)